MSIHSYYDKLEKKMAEMINQAEPILTRNIEKLISFLSRIKIHQIYLF